MPELEYKSESCCATLIIGIVLLAAVSAAAMPTVRHIASGW